MIDSVKSIENRALETQLHIRQLAQRVQNTFLEMGYLLHTAREEAHWSYLRQESFGEYVEELELPMTNSYSWVSRLIGIYEEFVIKRQIPIEELEQMGVSKLTRMLPPAKRGELSDELWNNAKGMSDMDLRDELGQKVWRGEGSVSIICPRCGIEIPGAKWVKGKQE